MIADVLLEGAAQPAPRVWFEVAERGELVVPCPLVSRGRPVFSSGGAPGSGLGEVRWVAVQAGVGPAQLLVNWAAHGGSVPADYVIETSAGSTNGRDGEWRRELSVAQNTAAARAHVIEFDGQSWVRLSFEGEASRVLEGAEPFARLDLHDASNGSDDCWLLLGDPGLVGAPASVAGETGWAGGINERYPGYFPALVDEARTGELPARVLERLDEMLATHSAARRVAMAFAAAAVSAAGEVALEALVAAVIERGRLPVLARAPAFAGASREAVAEANRRIDAIERRHGLVPGPDLAAWFAAHPEQLDAASRPTLEGRRAIERLWVEALDVWYVPQ
ncbi:MAG TPA: hypothetical protein VMG12_20040 [Polyangiaceae bacterium]|nr:hypothetical protein [Polyangiaceae bacterium]